MIIKLNLFTIYSPNRSISEPIASKTISILVIILFSEFKKIISCKSFNLPKIFPINLFRVLISSHFILYKINIIIIVLLQKLLKWLSQFYWLFQMLKFWRLDMWELLIKEDIRSILLIHVQELLNVIERLKYRDVAVI